jgi:CDP-2,3-bis-(O-geranylgeranyl)-sn-glycerol synthase
MVLEIILKTFYFMLPAYFANMAPVAVKDYFKPLAVPLDFNKKFKGKRILGSHKTLRGLLAGIVVGIIIAFIQFQLLKIPFFAGISLLDYNKWVSIGVLMGAGALIGDMIKSFFKRRVNIKPGGRWIPFDQLDYVIGALVFISVVYIPSLSVIITALILSFLLHIIANHLAYYLGIRKVKW